MKTRAAVAWKPNEPLEIVEVDLAPPGPGQVLIEMKATGICHSDLSLIEGKVARYAFPVVAGHEGAGIVLECGPGVTDFVPGDMVVPSAIPQCGKCANCLSGRTNICSQQWVIPPSPISFEGREISAFCGTATFAEHAVIHQQSLAKVRSDAPAASACYVGCGVMTGVGAALKTGNVTPGSSVAIFGLGGIGLNVLQGAKIAGARMIIGIDINADRDAIGRTFGMTHFINPKVDGDPVAAIQKLTGGGADFTFECVGNVELTRQAVESSHPCWGRGVAVGVAGSGLLEIDPRVFITGRQWTGSLLGGDQPKEAIPRLVDWYMDGFLKIDELISHRITLDEINRGFDMMRSGEATRTVVIF